MCFAQAFHDELLAPGGPVAPADGAMKRVRYADAATFRASLRAGTASPDDCPACEGRGGVILDDWGYEVDPCATCGGSGLREPEVTR